VVVVEHFSAKLPRAARVIFASQRRLFPPFPTLFCPPPSPLFLTIFLVRHDTTFPRILFGFVCFLRCRSVLNQRVKILFKIARNFISNQKIGGGEIHPVIEKKDFDWKIL